MTFETRSARRTALYGQLADGPQSAAHRTCLAFPCGRPTTAAAGRGLNGRYCARHAAHFKRHGSVWLASLTGAELKPHQRKARRFLRDHHGDQRVRLALMGIRELYVRAGPWIAPTNLRGLSPAERARAFWGRLRKAEVPPEKVLVAWLAVNAAIDAAPRLGCGDVPNEFRIVQVAKAVHRLAPGYHRRWETVSPRTGQRIVTEIHKYPASRGRVLRHIGEQLERAAEILAAPSVPNDESSNNNTAGDGAMPLPAINHQQPFGASPS